MHKFIRIFILTFIAVFISTAASAVSVGHRQDTLVFDTLVVADTALVQPADTIELSDSAFMAQMAAQYASNQEKKVVDRGFDVSRLVNIRRQRSVDITPFSAKPFLANTFVSARYTTNKILTEDYGFGQIGGLSFGKWVHEDHAVRITASMGQWQDNFDGSPITGVDASASYLFNLSSYVGGYRTNRLVEVMLVAGAGYSNSMRKDFIGHAANGHVGMNLNLRLFNGFDFFIEPIVKIYPNGKDDDDDLTDQKGMAVSYAGNWRTWLTAVELSCGLSYNIKPSKSPYSEKLVPIPEGWFASFQGGPHFQNSALVYQVLGLENSLGVHINLGIGKYYNDFFAMRYSAAYSRGPWVIYDDKDYPCNYFALRAEGMVDFVGLIRKAVRKEGKSLFSASLLFGPEFGYMYKVDHEFDEVNNDSVISSAYFGLTGGVQAKFRVTKRLSLFLEPRFSIMPYDAPLHDLTTQNDFRNYYDGIFNGNLGIEFML